MPRCVFAAGCRGPPSAWQSAASAARGWLAEDECVGGVDGNVWEEGLGQEREHGGGAWPFLQLSPPTLSEATRDWLLDRRAQVTFASGAERGRADRERS